MTGPGERLVTVLLTLAVPAQADAEDAAGLVADAAVSTALEVVSAAGVEGHLAGARESCSAPNRRHAVAGVTVQSLTHGSATLTDIPVAGCRHR